MKDNTFVRKYICVFIGIIYAITCDAHEISQSTAVFFAERVSGHNVRYTSAIAPRLAAPTTEESDYYYLINLENGWMIISGDDRVTPILAYSDTGNIDIDNVSPAMEFFLDCYKDAIDSIRLIGSETNTEWRSFLQSSEIPELRIVVPPLLNHDGYMSWKQAGNGSSGLVEKSYNKFCPPTSECEHPVVGCLAVAMAQILWYWRWPIAAIVKDDARNPIMRYYDWKSMPSILYDSTDEYSVDMVANLLHDCGVLVDMTYGCNASSASFSNCQSVFANFLSYDNSNMQWRERSLYSNSAWLDLIKSELENWHPILYRGRTPNDADGHSNGHAFVIDGYAEPNYFHVNLGGGPTANGFFLLEDIGFSNIYSEAQAGLFGIRPVGNCSPMIIDSNTEAVNPFSYVSGEEIILNNVSISDREGIIISGTSIELNEGVEIELGAEVFFNVENVAPCIIF